ncbi:hypothetical protein JCM10213_002230 [Rhodosporidiobolus nylandii]
MPPVLTATYTNIMRTWSRSAPVLRVLVRSPTDHRFNIPLDVVRSSGCNTLRFIKHLVQICVEEPGKLVEEEGGQEVDLEAEPEAKVYRFVPLNGDSFTKTRGPEGKTRFVAHREDSWIYEDYGSPREEDPDPADFLSRLYCRDGVCPFTGTDGDSCKVAHLVPPSRPDVYSDILDDDCPFLHHPSNGILLEGDTFFLHVFDGTDPGLRELNGRSFKTSFFRGSETNHIDERFCAWHYKQTVLKWIRAHSVGMEIDW